MTMGNTVTKTPKQLLDHKYNIPLGTQQHSSQAFCLNVLEMLWFCRFLINISCILMLMGSIF